MAGWILLHDPATFEWRDARRLIEKLAHGERPALQWECGDNRRVMKGDRVFLLRTGRSPTGLIGAGTVTRGAREESRANVPGGNGRRVLVIDIELDALADGDREVVMNLQQLQAQFPSVTWTAYQSARQPLPPLVLQKLDALFVKPAPPPAVPSAHLAEPPPDAMSADPLRLGVVAAWFAMTHDVIAGREIDVRKALEPVHGLLHREPGYNVDDALTQLAGYAAVHGHALIGRHEPQVMHDRQLAIAFEAYLDRFPQVIASLVDSLARAIPRKWPHIDDFRLYWTAPPKPGAPLAPPSGAREISARASGLRERLDHEWHRVAVDFALEYEKARLWQNGQREVAPRTRRVERDGHGGEGYDIESFESDGSPRWIAVKATRFNHWQPFSLCGAEIERACDAGARFHVYRLFDALSSPRFFLLQSRLHGEVGEVAAGARPLEWQQLALRAPWLRATDDRREPLYDYFI